MTNKERNAIKGKLRQVFARSELHEQIIATTRIEYHDPNRPRVKKWSVCPKCNLKTPTYKMQVDHIQPVVIIGESFHDLDLDEFVNRLWCDPSNLAAICEECHKVKTSAEQSLRHKVKKLKKAK